MKEEKQPHIALLIGALTRGGSERVMVNLAEYLAHRGWKVTMVTQYQKDGEYSLSRAIERVISDITPKETGKSRIVNFVRRFRKLRNIWKIQKPDVIMSFHGKNNMMSILTSRFLGIPVVVSVRAEPHREYYKTWMRLMAKWLFRFADGVILQTGQCAEFFPGAVQKKAIILKNPVSQDFFRERYEGIRKKEIVAVGRLVKNKNHAMAIRAFAEIAEQFPEYSLVIYGEGELHEELKNLAEDLGLRDRVRLPGAVEDVAGAIYEASVFLLTSDTEGVPNTLLEAMLLGLPVISTNCPCGGPADLIEHGVNGLLIPVQDQFKLQENLHFLLNNMQEMERLGREAHKTAAIYRPEIVYTEWEKYLKQLVFHK